ncbi:hypothetical protein HIM_01457 [Hirsutella minnesotensis 3608]|nr:hypothetical protein HIM_01457 [Hirsutella minnesotensis 3608]
MSSDAATERLRQQGPPYPPQGASLGGVPTVGVDVPVSAVIAACFVFSAAVNMAIFQVNLRRRPAGHKFIFSAVIFGFSLARLAAAVLRIVWACRPRDTRVAVAAQVFSNAGVVVLFVVNLFFAQRVLRAYHPRLGWSRSARALFRGLIAAVVACLVMVVAAIVYSVYTLDPYVRAKLRDVQLVAVVFLAVLAFLPVPIVLFTLLLPRHHPVEKFGGGRMRSKVALLLSTSLLLALGAGFRAGVAFVQRPADRPAWFHHKACYYCFNYLIELIVVAAYVASRFDRRFHVPDGSSQPGHYSRGTGNPEKRLDNDSCGSEEPPRPIANPSTQESEWESRLRDDLERQQKPLSDHGSSADTKVLL